MSRDENKDKVDSLSRRVSMRLRTMLLVMSGIVLFMTVFTEPLYAADERFDSMVQLTAYLGDQERVGSGFVVDNRSDVALVLTAGHVVRGRADRLVIGARFFVDFLWECDAEVIAQDNLNDLALLRVWPAPVRARPLQLSRTLPSVGTTVEIIGYPDGTQQPVPTFGWVSLVQDARLKIDARAVEGNSGGPVLVGRSVAGVVVESGELVQAVPSSIVQFLVNGLITQSILRSGSNAVGEPGELYRPEPETRGSKCKVRFTGGGRHLLRTTPSTKSPHAGHVSEGESVLVLGRHVAERRVWFRVQNRSKNDGWISEAYVEGCNQLD